MTAIFDFIQTTKTAPHWNRVKIRPHRGICLPLSALRSDDDCGTGDFGSIRLLIDWCARVGFDCLQLLPLSDSGSDPSPYNPISSCALNPLYIDLKDIPGIAPDDLVSFTAFKQLPRLAYGEVRRKKLDALFHSFERTFSDLSSSFDYLQFLKEHPWLRSYAAFASCKDRYPVRWKEWPREAQSPETCPASAREIDFYSYIQFHAFRQLSGVKLYASTRDVLLMGDMPILISPDSADVWANRLLFHAGYSAGAPPDMYNPLGQHWGFPLFNRQELAHTDFAWWKIRLKTLEPLFHLYRIDHAVGFFRIWAIRDREKPSQGRFLPENPAIWEMRGREMLELMIDSSPLLPIAEDLGTIPPFVRRTLHALGICGTKVMRWERRWHSDGGYIPPKDFDPISLTTVSTPDSETLQLWWKNQPREAKLLAEANHWIYSPELQKEQREKLLRDSHESASLFCINLLQEYLALFPDLVSSSADEERINIPGTLLPSNWTYRLKPSIQELFQHSALLEKLRGLLS